MVLVTKEILQGKANDLTQAQGPLLDTKLGTQPATPMTTQQLSNLLPIA